MNKLQTKSLEYKGNNLEMDGVSLEELAKKYGTPLYVYSSNQILDSLSSFQAGIGDNDGLICYAMKANSNLSIIKLLSARGCGMDIVSGGELYRARRADVPPEKIVFSGVGKTEAEIRYGLEEGVLLFVVESEGELRLISEIATGMGKTANISLRVNPDVDAKTHPYISTGLKDNKFGISYKEIPRICALAQELSGIKLKAIGCHIGSQLTELAPFKDAADVVVKLANQVKELGVELEHIDFGGGLGISYKDETPPEPADYMRTVFEHIKLPGVGLVFEPGRSLVGNAGVLLTRVLYEKNNEGKQFYICDAAMNDLLRPSLYRAYHEVLPAREDTPIGKEKSDLVGPVCETGDFLAKERELPEFKPGDLACLTSAGAYGFTMASNYNSRPRPAEVMIMGGREILIRERETFEDLVRGE